MRRYSLPLIGAIAALLVGLSVGSAYAYFTTPGAGSGATTVGTPSPVTVLQATGTVDERALPRRHAATSA